MEHDIYNPLLSTLDYCADYLALGDRFEYDYSGGFVGNTGPIYGLSQGLCWICRGVLSIRDSVAKSRS